MWHRVVDCLGVAVGITSAVAEIDAQLAAVFRTYAEATRAPDVAYRLERADWPRVIKDGGVASRHDRAVDLVPALELDLYREVTARAPGVLVHAAAVVGRGGEALVFAGRSGAGKSTLLRALLADGFAYLTEECVALFADGTCRGLARALHVEDDAIEVPAGFACDAYVIRRGDGERRTRLFHPPEARVWRGPARTAAIVAIDHAPDAADTREALGGGALLAALWPLVFRADPAAIADAPAILDGIARYRVHTARPGQALAHARAIAEELGVGAG